MLCIVADFQTVELERLLLHRVQKLSFRRVIIILMCFGALEGSLHSDVYIVNRIRGIHSIILIEIGLLHMLLMFGVI